MALTRLWLIRHGESVGNVAASRADAEGGVRIDLPFRDADTPLSDLGEKQAVALGTWFDAHRSDIAMCWVSPYIRARQTLEMALGDAGGSWTVGVDERLRDRELGILDLLTPRGVQVLHPEEAERRRHLGKYYHRPPGGESWADVALRLRSFLADTANRPAGAAIVAHDAVVMLLLSLLLRWDEAALLDFASDHTVSNASVTQLSADSTGWKLVEFSRVEHIREDGTPVTVHAGDDDVQPR